MIEEPRKLKKGETDSALEFALKWNKSNPIAYNGMWYPKGTLERVMKLATPIK